MRYRDRTTWAVFLLAALPLALYSYLGQFSRLMTDDFCHLVRGQDLGPWRYMLFYLNNWAGGYSNLLAKGLIAQLGSVVPRVLPATIVISWWFALTCLVNQVLLILRIKRRRWAIAGIVSAWVVAASVHAFPSWQSFIWMAASINYALPLIPLVLFLALAARQLNRGAQGRELWLMAFAGFLLCFVSAGGSEMFLVFQLVLLSGCLLLIVGFAPPSKRRGCLLIVGLGGLATLAGLMIQLMSPGVAVRAAWIGEGFVPPDRSLIAVAGRTLLHFLDAAAGPRISAGFILAFGIGLLLMLISYKPPAMAKAAGPATIPGRTLWPGLILQLIWLPVLWAQLSDDPLLFGRFSPRYMSVILLNIALIAALALVIKGRDRLNAQLRRHEPAWELAAMASVAMMLFALHLALAIHGRIDLRAELYLLTTAAAGLALSCHLLARGRGALAALCLHGLAYVALAATIAPGVVHAGHPIGRVLAPAAHLLVAAGLVWGVAIGAMVRDWEARHGAGGAWLRALKIGSLALVLVLAISLVSAQLSLVPILQGYARQWDENHDKIIAMRAEGRRHIEIAPLPMQFTGYLDTCTAEYYGVESIVVSDADAVP